MANPIEMQLISRVELLVHPFFALENARVKGEADSLRHTSEEEISEIYSTINIANNWKRKMLRIRNNPNAIMLIIGPQQMETERMQRYFYRGKLTPKKLAQFSQQYRELLTFARKTLGKRLFLVSQEIAGNEYYLSRLMLSRKMVPAKDVRVYGYGEYIGIKEKQCVEQNSEALETFFKKFQEQAHGNGTRTQMNVVHAPKVGDKFSRLSIKHGNLMDERIFGRLDKGRPVSPLYLASNFHWMDGAQLKDAIRIAKSYAEVHRKGPKPRETKRAKFK